MNENPKLSKNFNAKLFSEVNRKLLYKNLFNIILVGFFKGFVSVIDVIFSWPAKRIKQNDK